MRAFVKKISPGLAILLIASKTVFAQDIPANADPLRLNRPQQEIPLTVTPSPEQQAPVAQKTNIPEEYKNIVFVLKNIEIEGATIYSAEEFTAEYNHMIGREITLADILVLSDKLTDRYRQDGYVFARVML